MSRRLKMAVLALACLLVAAPVFGQGGTTMATLSGVVVDKDGGLVPGATVVVTNPATGEKYPPQITNASGAYSFPGLAPGKYKVNISLQGFKTVDIEASVTAGTANTIQTKLEVGALTEVVNVTSGTDLVRTDTPTVTQTVSANFINTLPRSDRNALSFLIFLPGVTTIGGGTNSRNNTTIAGLPSVQFNVTIDGVTAGNMLQSTDGFFSMVTPRLDAIEEVALVSSTAGVDASGQGAVQIKFVTRSGTNKFEISGYAFMQNAAFNSNTFFNRLNGLPVPVATDVTYGGRVGGPIIFPGVFDGRGRAFFFFNQEERYSPRETPRARTLLRDEAMAGRFGYGTTTVTYRNVLDIARDNGFQSTPDPTIMNLLASIKDAAGKSGVISDVDTALNTLGYDLLSPFKTTRHSSTINLTVNLTPKNRLQGSYYFQPFSDFPDTLNNGDRQFPDFPVFGGTTSNRTTGSFSLRSTISTEIVNEARGGWAWHPEHFFDNIGAADFANQGGYAVALGFGISGASGLGNNNNTLGGTNAVTQRNTANYTASDQLNWLKGSHAFTFGADFTRLDNWNTNFNHVPGISLGFTSSQDPADAMFNTTNFPGSSTGDRNNAKALYALLTGRVATVSGTGRLNEAGDEYVYIGQLTTRVAQDDYSFFAQDVWRWKPTVTVTAGLRYQYTLPLSPKSSVFSTISTDDACGPSGKGQGPSADGAQDRFCNMFRPGEFLNPGVGAPKFIQYTKDNKGYNTDFNNLGPVIGIAWRPNVQDGWLRKVLGDPELATINGGFTRSFVRARIDSFTNIYSGNPGQTVPATRSTANGAFPLVPAFAGDTAGWPILFSQSNRLGAPEGMIKAPQFPFFVGTIGANGVCTTCSNANVFNPDIEVPWTDSWNVSFQRSITKDTVFEVRYQGNRTYGAWTTEAWNGVNMQQGADSGGIYRDFYNVQTGAGEFNQLQANLHANIVAGNGPTMAFTGAPGTGAVPVTFAHLNGGGNPNVPANYTGTIWTSTTFTGELDPYFPDPYGFAESLYGTSFNTSALAAGMQGRVFNNAVAAGFPTNYWVLNPQLNLNSVGVTTNSSNRPMNHLVSLQVRRRLSQGLSASVSYTWQRNITGSLLDFHLPRLYLHSNGVPHAIQALWSYDIPVGRGKRYGSNMNAWLDGAVGGWTFSGTARFQTQSFHLRNTVLEGMTIDEARDALSEIRFVTSSSGAITVFNFPEDIYTNTRLAYNTDETSATYYATNAQGIYTGPEGPLATPTPDGRYRYFRPAGGPDCNFVNTGDCNITELRFLGRWFGEMDFRLAKAFQLPGKTRFEFSAEVFNATKALNFPNNITPGSGSGAFSITTTQSAARTAQLVWRVTW